MKHHRITKRGQIEVFGLAAIVVLISLGFFFVVKYHITDTPVSVEKEYKYDKLASEFVTAVLKVNIRECPEYTIQDVLVDCGTNKRITCDGISSCEIFNSTITHLANETFMKRYESFRLYTEGLALEDQANISFRGCYQNTPKGQRGKSVLAKYPQPGTISLNVELCKI